MKPLFLFCIRLFSSLISWFCYVIGWRASRWLFGLLGILWFDILRIRHKDVLQHIGIVFPNLSEAEKIKMGRRSMRLQTGALADLFYMPYMNKAWRDKYIVFEGTDHVVNARLQGKGVLLLGMHIGSGDLAANMITAELGNFHLITKLLKNKTLNDFWFSLRAYHGAKHIEPHGEKTPFQILKALKSSGLVVFVLDQFMGKPYGIETTFFDRKTGTAQGLAVFHLKTKAPVVPVYCYEAEDGRIHVVFEPALSLSSLVSDDKDRSMAQLTQYFCNITENVIRKHPEHWMWLHRRWKKFE
jgi:KDO2-lipid IV(A) lauroyltransferase